MEKVGVAVLGAGFMGTMHARVLADNSIADLRAVADVRSEVATRLAAELGTTVAADVAEIAERDDIDACIVALPDLHHVEATCRLLEAGKAILLEKPLAHTAQAAGQIIEAARRGPGRVMVGHLLRFDPRYARTADLVASGQLGELLELRAVRLCGHPGDRARGSSTRFLVGIHDMDAIQWITGQRVVEVFARSRLDAYAEHPFQIDDVVHCSLLFDGGAIGTLVYGWTLPNTAPWGLVAGLDITATRGSLHLKPEDTALLSVIDSSIAYQDSYYWPADGDGFSGNLGREVDHFLHAVAAGTPFRIDLDGPLAAVELSDAIERSLRSGAAARVGGDEHS
jgi:myo-inositol 2-dehydrogenase/D-chiro-inositol 1-dehydrogenase